MIRAFVLLAACAAMLTPPAAAQQGGYVVIVNDANSISALTTEELSKIFFKKAQRWPNGFDVVPVVLPESAPVREAFSVQVHGKSVGAVRAYWQQQIFSGRAVPPAERPSDEQVVAFVRSTPGAIGYVSTGATLAPGVRRLQVVR
jgi:ABC-type phosphate transport system substrate-binding protein